MAEGVVLARIYKQSVQRVACHLDQLNSHAAFIFTCQDAGKIVLWIGDLCSEEDVAAGQAIIGDIVYSDFHDSALVDTILEGKETELQISDLMDILILQIDDYKNCCGNRKKDLVNSMMILGVVARDRSSRELRMKYLCEEYVQEDGCVKPLFFPQIMTAKTTVVVIVGDQYDILFGTGVTKPEQAAIKSFVINLALRHDCSNATDDADVSRNIHSHYRGGSKIFQLNFRQDTVGAMLNESAKSSPLKSRNKVSGRRTPQLPRTKASEGTCTDCVGEVIMRLLGMTPTSSAGNSSSATETYLYDGVEYPAYGRQGVDPNEDSVNGDQDSEASSEVGLSHEEQVPVQESDLDSPSSPRSTPQKTNVFSERGHEEVKVLATSIVDVAVLAGKIDRAQLRTHIQYISPPRRGSLLLVLDLDHTLMDYSQRHVHENVKRPYLDEFLKEVYQYYDIVVWSQTSWHWINMKLSELNLLRRKDFKICFALDKLSMFTVNDISVKPMQVIWNLCCDRWGPYNTVHVDDLSRNFALNREIGLLVRPYFILPKNQNNLASHSAKASVTPDSNEKLSRSNPGESTSPGLDLTIGIDSSRKPHNFKIDTSSPFMHLALSPDGANRPEYITPPTVGSSVFTYSTDAVSPSMYLGASTESINEDSSGTNIPVVAANHWLPYTPRAGAETATSSAVGTQDDSGLLDYEQDDELKLLSRYLVAIARSNESFADIDHSNWRLQDLARFESDSPRPMLPPVIAGRKRSTQQNLFGAPAE